LTVYTIGIVVCFKSAKVDPFSKARPSKDAIHIHILTESKKLFIKDVFYLIGNGYYIASTLSNYLMLIACD